MFGLFFACLLGLITGYIAHTKNRSFLGWWFYGTMIFIVAIIHVALIASAKKCPHCTESVNADAMVCKHCGRDVTVTSGGN